LFDTGVCEPADVTKLAEGRISDRGTRPSRPVLGEAVPSDVGVLGGEQAGVK